MHSARLKIFDYHQASFSVLHLRRWIGKLGILRMPWRPLNDHIDLCATRKLWNFRDVWWPLRIKKLVNISNNQTYNTCSFSREIELTSVTNQTSDLQFSSYIHGNIHNRLKWCGIVLNLRICELANHLWYSLFETNCC